MWKFICSVCLCCVLLSGFSGSSYGAEKDELTWKAKALIADFQLKQVQLQQAQDTLTTFLKELDQKGFAIKDGVVVEKPKEAPKPPEKKPEPPKK